MPACPRRWHVTLWYAVVAVLPLFALRDDREQRGSVQEIPCSQFQQELAAGKIADVEIGPDRLSGSYRKLGAEGRPQRFVTVKVDPGIARELSDARVRFSAQPGPGWTGCCRSWCSSRSGCGWRAA